MEGKQTPETLVYKERTYDLTKWKARHPGGALVVEYFLGTDATVPMHMFHDMSSPMVQRWLPKFDRGPAPDHPLRAFDRDYLALEDLFEKRGWFAPSLPWFIYKSVVVVCFLLGALWLEPIWVKGLLLGLFIHQGAFLAHDTCHDAAFPRRIRETMGWFFGTVCFGLNHGKWTREHNGHHLINNRPLDDPQINNMPDLLYSFHEVENFERVKGPLSKGNKRMIAYAHLWLLPVLLLYGRANAIRAEIKRARRVLRRKQDPTLMKEARKYLKGVVVHFSLILSVVVSAWWQQGAGVPSASLLWIPVIAFALSGTLHLQLILSHGYRPRLYKEQQEELGMKIQILSNQNVSCSFLTAWFHGGLENHIEHHLFPRIPRHNLPKLRPYVKDLCARHDLPYQTDNFVKCVWDFLRSLARESAPLRQELRTAKRAGTTEAAKNEPETHRRAA